MSTEQKTNCTNADSLVSVKVDINKDLCCDTGSYDDKLEKYQEFVRLHGGKGIYYNYQLKNGVTISEMGTQIIDERVLGSSGPIPETISELYIVVYENGLSQEYPFDINNELERIPNIEKYVGKNISLVNRLKYEKGVE
ncbi:hypothetical protein MODO_2137 [Myroides odoratimimus]|uniref:Uncharacterized protein n=2 Tax=Myroides odoratimimus TaxID=76832 RepID=A0A0S7EI60_9FLAO|nr:MULTISPECIES: hypothetical protein [Myroides]AJA68199.1 hypothetical protein MYRA21_1024 [Myroides sp. A21]ALU25501.1 hypothetical protein AS202_04750 [Myroides odoratimimus]EHO06864.1 hypothetical protein HMPREF9712_03069 [Myroides odoratimimus CCUG 10230]EPH08478.1 hypothetical protein HMPREF9713_02933 [Myroides odoratimimus CCUG 12700]MDM1035460.1 hypothetical protein [Myroides odoratimimus]